MWTRFPFINYPKVSCENALVTWATRNRKRGLKDNLLREMSHCASESRTSLASRLLECGVRIPHQILNFKFSRGVILVSFGFVLFFSCQAFIKH